jgi:hypothetical protein
MTDAVRQDRLSMMWDTPGSPSVNPPRCYATGVPTWPVKRCSGTFSRADKNNVKDIGLGFDCRVLFQRAQCAINVESPGDKLNANLGTVARELAKVRERGLPEEEFNALVAQKISSCRSCLPPMPAPIPIF